MRAQCVIFDIFFPEIQWRSRAFRLRWGGVAEPVDGLDREEEEALKRTADIVASAAGAGGGAGDGTLTAVAEKKAPSLFLQPRSGSPLSCSLSLSSGGRVPPRRVPSAEAALPSPPQPPQLQKPRHFQQQQQQYHHRRTASEVVVRL